MLDLTHVLGVEIDMAQALMSCRAGQRVVPKEPNSFKIVGRVNYQVPRVLFCRDLASGANDSSRASKIVATARSFFDASQTL